MPKDDAVYLGQMLDMAKKACALIKGKQRVDFDRDETLKLALAHLIQTIGEAARHVSPESQQLHAQIPWKAIVSMRHKVVHDYMDLNEDVVWDTATTDLPKLISQLEKIVPGA